jgi:hypothetical protein
MSSEFEYRQLAAACLDLAKRTAVLADKTRLLLIAEAWFDLADRVTRKNGNVNGRVTAEHSIGALGSDGLPGSATPSDRHSGTADDSNPASN